MYNINSQGKIYFNNAATSYPKPSCVIAAVEKCINKMPFNPDRTGFEQRENPILETRKVLAEFFSCGYPKNVIFCSHATEALNLGISGYCKVHPGIHVVTTTIEHNSVIRPLKHLEKQGVISVTFVESDETGYISPKCIEGAIKGNTGLVVVNHASNVTGIISPIVEIGEICKKRGVAYLVDASQSAGAIEINMEEANIDMLAFTGHKSLMGITGIGGLIINREDLELFPLKVGGTGIRSDLMYQPEGMPIYYEAGTPNLVGIVALEAGIGFIKKTGLERIKYKKMELLAYVIKELGKCKGVTIYGPRDPHRQTATLTFNIEGWEPADVAYILDNSYGIVTRSGLHCAPLIHRCVGSFPLGSVRASFSFFNTFGEVEKLIKAVRDIAGK